MAKSDNDAKPSRRGFLEAAGGLLAAAAANSARAQGQSPGDATGDATVQFRGDHQAGIVTPQQSHTYFAALDLVTTQRADLERMLRAWTSAAADMALGRPAAPLDADSSKPAADSDEAAGLSPARLTITFGFGAGLFIKDGKDRYGLARQRPEALVDLPRFTGDQLVATRTDGDLSIQACADDPQVAFHAVRQLVRMAYGAAEMRWAQTGFLAQPELGETPRNLMGFKDGTQRPRDYDQAVWVGDEGADWIKGGSYVVVRRIRIALEQWDRTAVGEQERVIGRYKVSGAPLGQKNEYDVADFKATGADGTFVIAETAHVRLAAAPNNDGAQILRRGYSYNDGVEGQAYDAGLLFIAYQRDARSGFIKLFERMAKVDMLNRFVAHTGGGLFACPRGVGKGEYVGQRLLEA